MDSTSKRGSGKRLSDSQRLQSYRDQIFPVNELLRENMALLRVLFENCGINVEKQKGSN
jgi:hypothetical protein